jgi:hypothetical protein
MNVLIDTNRYRDFCMLFSRDTHFDALPQIARR